MTAQVPFLQRLSPAFRGGAHAARPALAPRFAPADRMAPLEHRVSTSTRPERPPSIDALPTAMPLVPKQDYADRRQTDRRPGHQDDDLPAARHAAAPAAAQRAKSVDAPVLPGAAPASVPAAAVRRDTPPTPTAQRHVEPVGAGPAPLPAPDATPPRAAALPAPQPFATPGPLSAATLAQRPTAAPPPPVIHVTIDRLDVRLPAPAPAPAAVTASRRTAATLPLADYLRQRREGGLR